MKSIMNAIIVFDPFGQTLLMCKRIKEPYLGLINLVGGKVNPNENSLEAAYRELEEETAITKKDIHLTHLMDFSYPLEDILLEVYVGQLSHSVSVNGKENPLVWISAYEDFFDFSRFAGEGNIGHMLLKVGQAGLVKNIKTDH